MIVDSHHHFWRVQRRDYHWMPVSGVLADDYLPDGLRPLLGHAGVDYTVLVQAAQSEAETAFLLELADQADFVAGVVGWLDFEDENFSAKLERLMSRPKFVGLRPMLQDLVDDAYILRPRVIDHLRHLESLDFPFDILTFPHHLPYVLRALARVPSLRAVGDHISKPPIYGGKLDGWAANMTTLAAHRNIRCRLSGMVTAADHVNWRPADLEPFIQHVFDALGEDRVMFGSDWPVCLRAASYGEVLNALRTIVDPRLTEDGFDKVFGQNAVVFYKLEVQPWKPPLR